jgi:hypothetical protein
MIILPQKIYFLGSLVIIFSTYNHYNFTSRRYFVKMSSDLFQCQNIFFVQFDNSLETDIWRSSPK